MKYHINYAHNKYIESQKINSESAINIGGLDASIKYNLSDLDSDFITKNQHILSQEKGAGYWIWKPYIIYKTLNRIESNDVIFYTDSGCEFISNIDYILEILEKTENGILLQELNKNYLNKNWTKRDTFFYMNLDCEPYIDMTMILGGFILLKKNKFTINFIKEWLDYCTDYRLITDSENECGLSNYTNFKSHRHDQSILSLLGRKYNIETIPDISQFGNDRRDSSQQILNLTRR
jgi:hypothetical protein